MSKVFGKLYEFGIDFLKVNYAIVTVRPRILECHVFKFKLNHIVHSFFDKFEF